MARLYGEKEDIEYDKVKNFFNKRVKKGLDSDLLIGIYENKDIAEDRNLEQGNLMVDTIDFDGKKVLEIGCGAGRFTEFIHDKCSYYLGFDLTEEHIEIANKNNEYENCTFQVMSAVDLKIDEFLIEPPFDVILISQVLLFINDKDLSILMDELNKITSDNKQMFVTETTAHDSRLTLKDFYSNGLEDDYNARYRTKEEFLSFFDKLNFNEIETYDMFMDTNVHEDSHVISYVMK